MELQQELKQERRQLYKTLARMSVPIIIQNFLSSVLNLVDTLMIGKIAAENTPQIAAVGFANQIFFVVTLFMFGLTSGAQVFVAQFYGKGDYKGIKKALSLGLITCGGFCLVAQFVAILFPSQLISLFTRDEYVIALGTEYLSIVAWSYFITGVMLLYSGVLRSSFNLRLPMMVSVVGIIVNIVLNYGLIYGKLGLPAMGVAGAAWATVIARAVQLLIILSVVYLTKSELALAPKDFKLLNKAFAKTYFKTSLPIVLNEGLWGLGTSIYAVVYGLISTQAAAASRLASTIEQFVWIFISSIATVGAILIGKGLGEGQRERTMRQAAQLNKIMLVFALILSAIMAACAPLFTSLYDISEDTKALSITLIIALAAFTPFKAMNFNLNIGILRSGGDTIFSFLLEISLIWLVSAPLGYLFGIPLALGIVPTYIIVHIDEIIKLPIFFKRFRSGKWAKDITEAKDKEWISENLAP